MWQHMFSMPVMRTVWRRELGCSPAHASTQYALEAVVIVVIVVVVVIVFVVVVVATVVAVVVVVGLVAEAVKFSTDYAFSTSSIC